MNTAEQAAARPEDIDLTTFMDVLEDYALDLGTRIADTADDKATAGHIIGDLGVQGISVLPTAYVLGLQAAALTAAPAGGWVPVPYPANKPAEEDEQYYVLTTRRPKEPRLMMWGADAHEDRDVPPAWCVWDGDYYEPTKEVITHFWPHPTV